MESKGLWPPGVLTFFKAWAVSYPGALEHRDRLMELWEIRLKKAGGARMWKSNVSSIISAIHRWCESHGISAGESIAVSGPQTMLLHLVKKAHRGFRASAVLSWQPVVVLALGVLQVDKMHLFHFVHDLGVDWPSLLESSLVALAAETNVDLSARPAGASDGLKRKHQDDEAVLVRHAQMELLEQAKELRRVLRAKSPHDVLDVSQWARGKDVRKAYRRCVVWVHPSKNSSWLASIAFRKLHAAFRTMMGFQKMIIVS